MDPTKSYNPTKKSKQQFKDFYETSRDRRSRLLFDAFWFGESSYQMVSWTLGMGYGNIVETMQITDTGYYRHERRTSEMGVLCTNHEQGIGTECQNTRNALHRKHDAYIALYRYATIVVKHTKGISQTRNATHRSKSCINSEGMVDKTISIKYKHFWEVSKKATRKWLSMHGISVTKNAGLVFPSTIGSEKRCVLCGWVCCRSLSNVIQSRLSKKHGPFSPRMRKKHIDLFGCILCLHHVWKSCQMINGTQDSLTWLRNASAGEQEIRLRGSWVDQ